MSEQHDHKPPIHYTVHLTDRTWWFGCVTLTMVGTGSSVQGNELLIFGEHGELWSVNYSRVRYLHARPCNGEQ